MSAWPRVRRPTSASPVDFAAMATTAEDLQTATPVVTLTPEAFGIVKEAIGQEPDPGSLALWLEVRGVQEGSFVYDLYFQAVSDAGEGDARHEHDELVVIVPEAQRRPPARGPARVVRGGRWRTGAGQPEHAQCRRGQPGRAARDPGQGHQRAAGRSGHGRARAGRQPVDRQPRWAGRPGRPRTKRTARLTCACPAGARAAPCRR